MRRLLLLLFLFSFISVHSQSGSKKDSGNIDQMFKINDSEHIKLQHISDSVQEEKRKNEELKGIERLSQQSAGYFAQLQKERHAKEKRNAMIRIGIGIVFFILLIVGLKRKVKK